MRPWTHVIGMMALSAIALGAFAQPKPAAPTTAPTTRPRPGANAPSADQLMNSMLKPRTVPDTGAAATPALPSAPAGAAATGTTGTGTTGGGSRVLVPLPDPPKVDVATGKVVAPNPPQPTLMREGSPILDRTGRLTPTPDGQSFQFSFDSDAKNMLDPPLLVLPNLNLMSMENLISSTNKDLKFKVSGTVTEYKGRNYILIEKASALHDVTQQF